MNVPLIGLSGYARSGKDTAGRALVDLGWERRSFADRLREFLLALDPIAHLGIYAHRRLSDVVADFGWETAKDNIPEVRALLQRCGTEAGRVVLGENVWVDATLRDLDPAQPVVITDVRFPNEAAAIQEAGGIVVRIERAGVGPTVGADGTIHASETAMTTWPFDAVLRNDGTVAELRAAMWDLIAPTEDVAA